MLTICDNDKKLIGLFMLDIFTYSTIYMKLFFEVTKQVEKKNNFTYFLLDFINLGQPIKDIRTKS